MEEGVGSGAGAGEFRLEVLPLGSGGGSGRVAGSGAGVDGDVDDFWILLRFLGCGGCLTLMIYRTVRYEARCQYFSHISQLEKQ